MKARRVLLQTFPTLVCPNSICLALCGTFMDETIISVIVLMVTEEVTFRERSKDGR